MLLLHANVTFRNEFLSSKIIYIVFPTSVWSEASEKSEYLMNFRQVLSLVVIALLYVCKNYL